MLDLMALIIIDSRSTRNECKHLILWSLLKRFYGLFTARRYIAARILLNKFKL